MPLNLLLATRLSPPIQRAAAPRGRSAVRSGWPIASLLASLLVGLFLMAAATAVDASDFDAPTGATARPRLRVAPDNAAETDVRECLNLAVDAANSEDLDAFVDCFTGTMKTRLRKPAALRFAEHDVTMELTDAHIVRISRQTCEVAVKYRLLLSADRFDVVSLVALKQEQGTWRISAERIRSYEHQSPGSCSPSRYACLGAVCRLD